MDNARRFAYDVLRRVESRQGWSSRLLQRAGESLQDPREIALAHELVHGVLRRKLWLDLQISRHSSRRLEKIEPDLLQILRLAAYQIFYLDRIPARAAVSEAVNLARECGGRAAPRRAGAAGFVNAVLRALAREGEGPRPGPSDDFEAQASYHSYPTVLAERWKLRMGMQEACQAMAAGNKPAPIGMRVATSKTTPVDLAESLRASGIDAQAGRFLPGFLVAPRGQPHRTAAFERGDFYIQDEASALVATLAAGFCETGGRALDVCAAPGGKAFVLAERVGPAGFVVANDARPDRLDLLRQNLIRLGIGGCVLMAADLTSTSPFRVDMRFDLVLIDAPCSGTGVLRRNPELRYRFNLADLDRLAAQQAALLRTSARLVAPGGILVYAVCSLEPEEGVDQVARFLGESPSFEIEDPHVGLPETARCLISPTPGGALPGQYLTTLPHRDGIDGFFAVVFRRQRGSGTVD